MKRYFQENKSYNLGEVITTQLLYRINKYFYRQNNRTLHRKFKQVFHRKGNRAKKHLRNVNENLTEIQFYNLIQVKSDTSSLKAI